jgi:hypothetical protein
MPQHCLFSRDHRGFVFFTLKNKNKLLHPLLIVLPNNLYKVPFRTPLINTIYPQTILQVSFSNTICTPISLILLTYIKFLSNSRMCKNPRSVLIIILLSLSYNLTFPHHMILVFESSPRKTSPPLYFLYSQNHSLWGVI